MINRVSFCSSYRLNPTQNTINTQNFFDDYCNFLYSNIKGVKIIKATDPFGVTFNKLVIPNDIDAHVERHFRQNNIKIVKI